MALARFLHLGLNMEQLKWTPHHAELQTIMKQETKTLRELLANFHQEEMLILNMNDLYWNRMIEERQRLLRELTDLGQRRCLAIESIQIKTLQMKAPLKSLLPLNLPESWEILSLQDQILTLWDRMNLQTSRNHMVKKLQPQSEQKNKIEIATETPEDYSEGDGS